MDIFQGDKKTNPYKGLVFLSQKLLYYIVL